MISPRWRKMGRDLRTQRGRLLLMVIAVAVSLTVISAVLGAYAILMREMPLNYAATKPASATLELGKDIPRSLLDEVRTRPGITDAEARGFVRARVNVGGEWQRLMLYVIDDFNDLRFNVFRPVSGAWPPPDGTMLVERMAVPILRAQPGDQLLVKTPHGSAQSVLISGVVHDPGQAQAWQEHAGYGYITRKTLGMLGEPAVLDELRVGMDKHRYDLDAIEATARELAEWLGTRGHSVHEIHVPPPGKHPHQFQITLILTLEIAFGAMALILSAILVASLIDAMLARQIREIGVMKAVGARTLQIAGIYAAIVALIGTTATTLALLIGMAVGRRFANAVSAAMNFTLTSDTIPPWVYIAVATVGITVPLLIAAVPILRSTRLAVRQAIDQWGVSAVAASQTFTKLLRTQFVSRTWALAARNAFRQRMRLLITVALLAVGGAIFMTALNLLRGWERNLAKVVETRHYDVEIHFSEPQPTALAERIRGIPGVRLVEAWGSSPTAVAHPREVILNHAYPDHAHGSTSILGPPADTKLIQLPLRQGRWLMPDDTDAVVLTPSGAALFPGVRVGDSVMLSVYGVPTRWRVVGLVEEFGPAPVAYVTDKAFARAAATGDAAQLLRVATDAKSADARNAIVRLIEDELVRASASIDSVFSVPLIRSILDDHMGILTGALVVLSLLMAAVGAVGLASTMSISVLERTRELGVMKAIGATPGVIARIIVGEGLLAGALSWVFALTLAVPLTFLVGRSLGMVGLGAPVSVLVSPTSALAWLAIMCATSIAASLIPANRASKLTVREALAHS